MIDNERYAGRYIDDACSRGHNTRVCCCNCAIVAEAVMRVCNDGVLGDENRIVIGPNGDSSRDNHTRINARDCDVGGV